MFNHPVICKTLFRGGIRNEKYHFDLARRNELFEEFVQLPKSEAALATGLALSCGFVPLEKYTKKRNKNFEFTKADTALVTLSVSDERIFRSGGLGGHDIKYADLLIDCFG